MGTYPDRAISYKLLIQIITMQTLAYIYFIFIHSVSFYIAFLQTIT